RGVHEVVERTEDVVVVAGRVRELQEHRIRDFAGRAPSEETALEQVLLGSPSGPRDLRRGPDGTLVLEQPLQHADRGVERRARALRRVAVPATVRELLIDETAREALRRAREARLPADVLGPPEALRDAYHRRVT